MIGACPFRKTGFHPDFDLPSVIYDLPFLTETAKRNILGLTAARIFGLDPTPRKTL